MYNLEEFFECTAPPPGHLLLPPISAAFMANVKCWQLACQDVLFDAGATPATFAVSSGSQVHLTGRVFD